MKKYKISSDCILVKGFSRSAIYDCTRSELHLIPQRVFNILSTNQYFQNNSTLFNSKNKVVNYFKDYMIENEIIHEVNLKDINCFPSLDLSYNAPNTIQSCVIYIDPISRDNISILFNKAHDLGCLHFIFVFPSKMQNSAIKSILTEFNLLLKTSEVYSIEIAIDINNVIDEEFWITLNCENKRFSSIIYYNSNEISIKNNKNYSVKKTNKNLEIFDNKSRIQSYYIDVDIRTLTEAQEYNIFYHKKIFVFNNKFVYGDMNKDIFISNIEYLSKDKIINNVQLQEFWRCPKKNIAVCMDCEFRYACPDDRKPIKIGLEYHHKFECNYNPYIIKWKHEKGFVSVEQWRTENPYWEKKANRKSLVKKPQPIE